MAITRRDFLKYCGASAVALGLSSTDLLQMEELLANPSGPTVLWLQGAGCTGCSMSFLNRVSPSSPGASAADVLINSINLAYHPNLMAMAGQDAASLAEQAYSKGGYILAVEGGVPTGFGGEACWAWTYNGTDVTFQQAVTDLASRATKILCVGTCASFGGIPAAGANPAQVKSVKAVTGKSTINISGCPAHPDWIVYTIVQLLKGAQLPLDTSGRPNFLYGATVHSKCPRNSTPAACLAPKGCRGPGTHANCPTNLWNNGNNWCVNANAPCYGCVEPTFPGTASLYTMMYNHNGTTNLNCSGCHTGTTGGGSGGTNYLPNPHGRNYTANDCISCHGTVPAYTPPSPTPTPTPTPVSYLPNPHGHNYTAADCIGCHGNVPTYP